MKVPVPVNPKRKLGQNFLRDTNVIDKIATFFEPAASDHVLEIGAGTGALTAKIAPFVSKLTAVELDASLIPYLNQIPGVEVIQSDILDVDLNAIANGQQLRIIGNLPYYISSSILLRLIRERAVIQDMTLMFQEEVALRITAPVSSSEYGLLSVASQYFCSIDKGFRISKNSFFPKPEIESRVLKFVPRQNTRIDPSSMIDFLQKAFSQRRKKLRNNLLRTLGISAQQLDDVFRILQIPENARAENLTPEMYDNLIYQIST